MSLNQYSKINQKYQNYVSDNFSTIQCWSGHRISKLYVSTVYLLFIYSIIKFTWALVGCNVVCTTFSDLQTSWLLKNICKIRSSMPAYCTIIIIHQRNLACLLVLHFIYQCQRLRRDSPISLGVFQQYMMSILFGGCVIVALKYHEIRVH